MNSTRQDLASWNDVQSNVLPVIRDGGSETAGVSPKGFTVSSSNLVMGIPIYSVCTTLAPIRTGESSTLKNWRDAQNSRSFHSSSAYKRRPHRTDLLKTLQHIRASYWKGNGRAVGIREGKKSSTFWWSDKQIQQLAKAGPRSISRWVNSVAVDRNILVHHGPIDNFALAASRLADAETDLDPTEEKLIALRRARVITSYQRGLLQVGYLR